MKSRREELKRRAQAAPKMPWGPRRYDAQFKRDVTEYGRKRQREGASVGEIAEELGLSAGTLKKWMRWAKLLIEMGKVPFELRRRRSGKAHAKAQEETRRAAESQQGASAEPRGEAQPEPSEETPLVLIVKLSGMQVEQATREQLYEWLCGPSRAAPPR